MTEICIYYDSRITIYDRRAFKRMATVEKIAWKLAFTKWSQSATKHSGALRCKKIGNFFQRNCSLQVAANSKHPYTS